MMTAHVISAQLEIRQVLARYARGVDRRDLALLKSVYHPDATDDHGIFRGTGHAFAEWLLELHSAFPHNGQHFIHQSYIEVDGTTAVVESYYSAINPMLDERTGEPLLMPTGGRYLDRFELRNGEWKIAERICTIDWSRRELPGESWDGSGVFAAVGITGQDASDAFFGPDAPARQRELAERLSSHM